MQICFLLTCIVLGALGAGLGAWVFSQTARAQLKAQRRAFELASEQVQRDLQQALLCVPQWVQKAARVELELLGRQHTERHRELLREQKRWQADQEDQRQAEWRALLLEPVTPRPPKPNTGQPSDREPGKRSASVPPPTPADVHEATSVRRPQPVPVAVAEELERELTDEEIDALPPDLPPPVRSRGRKMSAPNKPILRNI